MRSFAVFLTTIVMLTLTGACPQVGMCESKLAPEASFLPTWKLMNNEAKQQFIAGYLFGWRDAGRVTDAAIEYAREHPSDAVNGLEKIRSMYDTAGLSSERVVGELDSFFASDGKDATLSQAITVVRRRLGH